MASIKEAWAVLEAELGMPLDEHVADAARNLALASARAAIDAQTEGHPGEARLAVAGVIAQIETLGSQPH